MRRPFKDKRLLGPFLKSSNSSSNIFTPPENIEPPKVTDSKGNESYWSTWTDSDGVGEVPPRLLPVTGIYYPDLDWVVIDDRINIHHTVQYDLSKKDNTIPDMRNNRNIPFAHDYFDREYGDNIVGLQDRNIIPGVERWESEVSIPEEGSLLYSDEDESMSVRDITSKGLYHIAYALMSVGVEPQSTLNVVDGSNRHRVHLDTVYSELPMLGLNMVPEQKFKRKNTVVKQDI